MKRIDKSENLTKLLKLIEELPQLEPNYKTWNISGSLDHQTTVYLIDSQYMPLFEKFKKEPSIKILNLGRPAFRITYFISHRYWIKKPDSISNDLRTATIQPLIDQLVERRECLSAKDSGLQRQEIDIQIRHWQDVIHQPQNYDVAISNYKRYYFYYTINYKFIQQENNPEQEYRVENTTDHLIKNLYDKTTGQLTRAQYNICFVDTLAITKPDPNQHKLIEKYLDTFPTSANLGQHFVYARPKNESAMPSKT
jgi:hypothetical protein